jgi:RHS repeat-associated protein
LTRTDSAGTTTYTYDVLGNLRQAALADGTVVSYAVDGANRRIRRSVNGVPAQGFLYQGQLRVVAELDGAGAVVSRFVYGTGVNVPEYLVRGGATYRIVTDHLGSVRLAIDTATGTIAQQLDYDPFGRVVLDTNPGFQPFAFAGGLYDPLTGLVRFGARDYDAETGRWTSKDPIGFGGGDSSLYGYVLGDPMNATDPAGFVNPVKIFSALANAVNTGRLYGVGVLRVAVGLGLNVAGPGNPLSLTTVAVGAWNIRSAGKAQARMVQLWCEAFLETRERASWKNLLGVLPFGTAFDDPNEPTPTEWVRSQLEEKGVLEVIEEVGSLFP